MYVQTLQYAKVYHITHSGVQDPEGILVDGTPTAVGVGPDTAMAWRQQGFASPAANSSMLSDPLL